MIAAVVMLLLGITTTRLSAVRSRVWNTRICSIVPSWPATWTKSPSRNGRSTISMMPAAMLDSESFIASAIARPAAPSTAMIEVTGTPNCCRAMIAVTTSMAA